MNLDKSSLTVSSDKMHSLSINSTSRIFMYDVHHDHLLIDLNIEEKKIYLNSELVESLTASEYGKAVAESIAESLKLYGLHIEEVHDE